MLTLGVYGPMNEELARVGGDAPADVLARQRSLLRPVELLERCAHHMRVVGLTRAHSSLLLAPVTRNGRTRPG